MNHLINILISFLLLSLCLALSRAAISISIVLSIVLIIYLFIRRKVNVVNEIKKIDKIFLISYILFFILLSITSFLLMDFKGFTKVIKFMYYSLPFWLLYILANIRFAEKSIKNILRVSMILVGIFSLYDFFSLPIGKRISGIYPGPNWAAVLLGLNIPFVIMFTVDIIKDGSIINKFISVFASCVSLFSLLCTGSRGGIIGFVVGTLFTIVCYNVYIVSRVKNFKYIFIVIIVMLFSFAGIFANSNNGITRTYDMERIYLLKASYNMWLEHKITGVGLENWAEYYKNDDTIPDGVNKELNFPHNMIAYFFSTSGIIGGTGFLIFSIGTIISLLKNLKNQPNNIFLIAMIWAYINFQVHGMVDAGLLMKDGERLLFTWLGITYSSIVYYRNRTKYNN